MQNQFRSSEATETASLSDGQLVALVLEGNPAAFEALYRSSVGAVRHILADGLSDPQDVSDLIQEVYTRALERMGTLRDPDRFRQWLMAIARHALIDWYRAKGRASIRSLEEEPIEEVPDGVAPLDEAASLAELARMVSGCLGTLSPRDIAAIGLVNDLGLTPTEVGEALGVKATTAKVIVHRARRRLRHALIFEMIARRHYPGCSDFESICDDDIMAADQHLRSCLECRDMIRSEIEMFGMSVKPDAARPADVEPLGGHPGQAAAE